MHCVLCAYEQKSWTNTLENIKNKKKIYIKNKMEWKKTQRALTHTHTWELKQRSERKEKSTHGPWKRRKKCQRNEMKWNDDDGGKKRNNTFNRKDSFRFLRSLISRIQNCACTFVVAIDMFAAISVIIFICRPWWFRVVAIAAAAAVIVVAVITVIIIAPMLLLLHLLLALLPMYDRHTEKNREFHVAKVERDFCISPSLRFAFALCEQTNGWERERGRTTWI